MYSRRYSLYKKKKKYSKSIIALILISCFLIFSVLIINIFSSTHRDSIIGRWESEKTGNVVNFKPNGEVKLTAPFITATYHIITPNLLEYTVSDMSFEMIYRIQDNKLYWGIDESNLEVFIPK